MQKFLLSIIIVGCVSITLVSDSIAGEQRQEEPSSIHVTIRDEDGALLEGIRVMQFDFAHYYSGQEMRFEPQAEFTNEKGEVTFDSIPDHGFHVQVGIGEFRTEPNYMGFFGSRPSRTDPLIEVTTEGTVLRVEFEIHKPVGLNFVLREAETEKPIRFASIHFKDERTEGWHQLSFFDAEGQNNFTTIIEEMKEAEYLASRQGYYPTQYRVDVPMIAGEISNQFVILKPAPDIIVTVLDPNGEPAEGVKIDSVPDEGMTLGSYRGSSPTDESGTSRILYPSLGEMTTLKFEHESGTAEFDMKDIPMETFVESDDGKVPVFEVTVKLSNN